MGWVQQATELDASARDGRRRLSLPLETRAAITQASAIGQIRTVDCS